MTLRMDASGSQSSLSGDGCFSLLLQSKGQSPDSHRGAHHRRREQLLKNPCSSGLERAALNVHLTLPLEDGDEGSNKTESSSLPCRILWERNERKPVMFVS